MARDYLVMDIMEAMKYTGWPIHSAQVYLLVNEYNYPNTYFSLEEDILFSYFHIPCLNLPDREAFTLKMLNGLGDILE